MSDFDMMLQRKKSMSGKRRRNRDGGTFISDADDVVSAMIVKMNEAAEVRSLHSRLNSLKRNTRLWEAIPFAGVAMNNLSQMFLNAEVFICKYWKHFLCTKHHNAACRALSASHSHSGREAGGGNGNTAANWQKCPQSLQKWPV